jgi:membrane protein implicated in regulation of membrane protease activity
MGANQMQFLIVVLLLVIAVVLAPGFFLGLAALVLSAGNLVLFSLVSVVIILAVVYVWHRRSSDPVRQQAKEERRIRKITDAANRKNSN